MLLLDVLPKRCSVILEASMFSSLSSRFFCSSSSTVLLAAWTQKRSNASLKSGMYGLFPDDKDGCEVPPPENKCLETNVAKKRSCSEKGKTRGPKVVMLVFKASPPISTSSLLIFSPFNLFSSSSWYTHLWHHML